MTADQEIELLDLLLRQLHIEHPKSSAILRINNTTFRACTKTRWEAHNWSVTDDEAAGIMNGNDEERKAALLSLLRPQRIHRIEIVPGADKIEVVPDIP
jgi:hypothetical protein